MDVEGFVGAGVGLLVGMVGHEYAHARVADTLGDRTPRMMGRLTINPKAHVDPFGTIVMPAIFLVSILFSAGFGFIFGYAKPVQINPRNLRNPRRDSMLVALAGPGFNLGLAILAGLGFRAIASPGALISESGAAAVLTWIVFVNVFMAIINILPIPPLDGSKVLARFLPPQTAMRMEELGQYFILFIILLFLVFPGVIENMARPIYRAILF